MREGDKKEHTFSEMCSLEKSKGVREILLKGIFWRILIIEAIIRANERYKDEDYDEKQVELPPDTAKKIVDIVTTRS